MLNEIPYALLVGGIGLVGLYLANVFYDYDAPQYITRKVGHLGGCAAFLLCPFLFETFWWPLVLSMAFTALLLYARAFNPAMFRGVGGAGRLHALAEIHFPATGIATIGICWGLLGEPWLAIVPLAFMGAGDAITGLVRSKVYAREVKGNWGSLGMLATCLLLAYFITPYWTGVAGAIVAVIAERFTRTTKYIDDNLTIPLASAFIMVILYFNFGGG